MWMSLKKHLMRRKIRTADIFPEEIFLDSSNLPQFNKSQLEGRIERPISRKSLFFLGFSCVIIGLVFFARIGFLQVAEGDNYNKRSEQNRLRHAVIFPDRGIIRDRKGLPLVTNERSEGEEFSRRKYTKDAGFGHLLGFVSFPSRDSAGFYYDINTEGLDGAEKYFNARLAGVVGLRIVEINATGEIQSEGLLRFPKEGESITLSVDKELQNEFYRRIKSLAESAPFFGGAGAIMDIETGEIIAMTSYPEYEPEAMTGGNTAIINKYRSDDRKPFLNRPVSGLYTPGSIVKPFIAAAALEEGVIDPSKEILSTGSISVPNPFDKTKKSVFNDWRAHGLVDMRKALAVSSNVYFFEVGGGFENQAGLGILNIEKYMRLFGFGTTPPGIFEDGEEGTIPSPTWKAENFEGESWRIGDTYNTAIGQYGFQVTPIQALRAVSAVANGGKLVTPSIEVGGVGEPPIVLPIKESNLKVVREGMRLAVQTGTARALDVYGVRVAAKTGTAEIGTIKKYVNSLVIGFFPYEHPRFAFVVVMEKGPRGNLVGAPLVMRELLEWLVLNRPEYIE